MQHVVQDMQFNCQNMVRDLQACMRRLRSNLQNDSSSGHGELSLDSAKRDLERQIFSQ